MRLSFLGARLLGNAEVAVQKFIRIKQIKLIISTELLTEHTLWIGLKDIRRVLKNVLIVLYV